MINNIAKFLTGFEAIVLAYLGFSIYRFVEIQTLFNKYLPLDSNKKLVASILIAFVLVFSLTLFGSNIDRFRITKNYSGEWVKWILVLLTIFINSYFWQVWDFIYLESNFSANHNIELGFRITITVIFGLIDFGLNHLMLSLWQEKQAKENATQSVTNLVVKETYLKQAISKQQKSLKQLIAKQDPKVCPRCSQEFDILQQRNAHLRTCKNKI